MESEYKTIHRGLESDDLEERIIRLEKYKFQSLLNVIIMNLITWKSGFSKTLIKIVLT